MAESNEQYEYEFEAFKNYVLSKHSLDILSDTPQTNLQPSLLTEGTVHRVNNTDNNHWPKDFIFWDTNEKIITECYSILSELDDKSSVIIDVRWELDLDSIIINRKKLYNLFLSNDVYSVKIIQGEDVHIDLLKTSYASYIEIVPSELAKEFLLSDNIKIKGKFFEIFIQYKYNSVIMGG